jgi:hypothetical protein
MLTAHNDDFFMRDPWTAINQRLCFKNALADSNTATAIYLENTSISCAETGDRSPIKNGGHYCPLKHYDGFGPQTTWVLMSMQLYA